MKIQINFDLKLEGGSASGGQILDWAISNAETLQVGSECDLVGTHITVKDAESVVKYEGATR